jgi:hypothetical protein
MSCDPARAEPELAAASGPWRAVDALVERAPRFSDLRSHRLELFAARRWRAEGRRVPADVVEDERVARVAALTVGATLGRVRAAYDGPTLLLKGPETAACYPDPSLRGYKDLDLLVADPGRAWRSLVWAGFEPVGDPDLYIGIHHLRPLVPPGLPLAVELHSEPKWVAGLEPPSLDELFDASVPSVVGVPGVGSLPPAHHALLLAVHSWAHEPLRRLRDMVDVAAVTATCDRAEIDALAARWGVGRVWRTTAATIDALFDGGPTPWALRIWAQNLARVRERTVLENHAQAWLSGFWALPPGRALGALARAVAGEVRPMPGEGWRAKGRRVRIATTHAFARRSEHEQQL